jgi:hypothetical protein
MSTVLTYEPNIQGLLDTNWMRFKEFATFGTATDMELWATYFAYDVVSELGLGQALGMVKSGYDVGDFMKSILSLFFAASNMGHVPGQS